MGRTSDLAPTSWLGIVASAFTLFDDAEARGFGTPPFSLGGGTVPMLRFRHRLSRNVDLFGDDARWMSVLTPRLNADAAALASDYSEQANTVEIAMPHGDIDVVVAADVAVPVERGAMDVARRRIAVDPTSEILAKTLDDRSAGLKARDISDLSTAPRRSSAASTRCAASTSHAFSRASCPTGGRWTMPTDCSTGARTPSQGTAERPSREPRRLRRGPERARERVADPRRRDRCSSDPVDG